MSEHKKGLLYVSATAFLWAILPFFLIEVFKTVDPISVVWFRFGLAALGLVVIFCLNSPASFKSLPFRSWQAWAASVFLLINYYGFSKGLQLTNPSATQVLIHAAPLGFTLLGVLLFRERLSQPQIVGLIVAVCGFTLFYRDQIHHLVGNFENYKQGVGLIILAALSWAFYAACSKSLSQKIKPQQINLIVYGFSAVALLPWVRFESFLELDHLQWACLIFAGLNTLLAYGALAEAMKRISTAQVSIVIALNPLLTIALSWIATQLNLSWASAQSPKIWGFIGAIFVILGAIAVVAKPRKKKGEAR